MLAYNSSSLFFIKEMNILYWKAVIRLLKMCENFLKEKEEFFCLPFGALKPIFSIHVSKQLKNKKVDMNEKSNSSGICWSVVVVVYMLWAVLFTLHSVQLFENNFTQFVEMWKNIIDENEKMLWGNLSHRRLSNCLVCECNNDK